MTIGLLLHSDNTAEDSTVKRHSSANQFASCPLTVMKGGIPVPITFDMVDYISCDRVVSHRAMLGDENSIGYNFPMMFTKKASDVYAVYDKAGVVVKQLPAWAGEGFYKEVETGKSLLTGDTNALGVHNVEHLRIGLDYVLAEQTLPATD